MGSLPIAVPPKKARWVGLTARLPMQAGMFTRVAGLLFDDGGIRRVPVRVVGQIGKDSDGSVVAAGAR